ncbi:phenylalanine--tRNA ligase subunit beta [Candidatus Wolfebacteria bacterium]|nr:phenylalanine--tRNA ligase subunit beta [Candidatus Wolfebacteria bacterium]
MKFSYTLLKKLVPEVKSKDQVMQILSLHAFEAEEAPGNTVNISVPPNRFSDASSHIGIAREVSAILGKKLLIEEPKAIQPSREVKIAVSLKEPRWCSRASAQYFEVSVGPSPAWMKKILEESGLRSINALVDVTNYVMLEVGQPLHAFDLDKMESDLLIRRARKGEDLVTLDGKKLNLDSDILVLADTRGPLDVAGIKGGKRAEISSKTKRILLTACTFDPTNIYTTSRKLNLFTDASLRFSHGLHPLLVEKGMRRAAELLVEIAKARAGKREDVNRRKPRERLIPFSFEKLDAVIGARIPQDDAEKHLKNLGFAMRRLPQKGKLSATPLMRAMADRRAIFVVPPPLRDDIETFEDVAEEVARLYGYGKIGPRPPRVHLLPSGFEDQIVLKDKIRRILAGMGVNEVYGYSFLSKAEASQFVFPHDKVSLQNPISEEFEYLRPSLAPGLVRMAEANLRFSPGVGIFEIGKIFYEEGGNVREHLKLGIALVSKAKREDSVRGLKGLVREFLKKAGLVDVVEIPESAAARFMKDFLAWKTRLRSGGEEFGYIASLFKGPETIAVCEVDLDALLRLISEEHEYRPLPRYPSVMRDLSLVLSPDTRVGEMMQAIQEADRTLIDDVDIIDEYSKPGQSVVNITLRIVFQSEDRTLMDAEVNDRMKKIEAMLVEKFKVTIR